MDIVLASGSPRRKELLETLGLEFAVCPAKGEECPPQGAGPDETVKALSLAKAREVAQAYPEALIIAADTIVWADSRILGKPRSEAEAEEMLAQLSGSSHEVYTGVTLICGEKTVCRSECTKVFFRALGEDEIRAYVKTGEPMDKAGSYGIQGKGTLLVESITGSYDNVVGLPLVTVYEMMKVLQKDV